MGPSFCSRRPAVGLCFLFEKLGGLPGMKRRIILQHCQRSAKRKGYWAPMLSNAVPTSSFPSPEAAEILSSWFLRNPKCRMLIKATGDVRPLKPDSHPRVRVLTSPRSLDFNKGSSWQRELLDGDCRINSGLGSECETAAASRTSEKVVFAGEIAGCCSSGEFGPDSHHSELVIREGNWNREVEKGIQSHLSHLKLKRDFRSEYGVKDPGNFDEGAFSSDGVLSSIEMNASPNTAETASTGPQNLQCEGRKPDDQIYFNSRGTTTVLGNPDKMNAPAQDGGVNSSIHGVSWSILNHEDPASNHISEEHVDKLSELATRASELESSIAETATDGSLQFTKNVFAANELDSRPNGDTTTTANVDEQLEKSDENGDEGILSAACVLQPGDAQLYPVPISPIPGEAARVIELERAMVAEMKMKSGPAITRNEVLYEDQYFLVVNKPCGVYSEHMLQTVSALLITERDARASESFLSQLNLRQAPSRKEKSGLQFHMANRLDRDTSGLMIITKCKNAAKQFSNIFTRRYVQKSYIALSRGSRPPWTSLSLETGHGRSRHGFWRVYSRKDVGRELPGGSVVRDMTTQLTVVAVNREPVSRQMIETECCTPPHGDHEILQVDEIGSNLSEEFLLKTRGTGGKDDVVIRAIPKTGRTHQIRLHCQLVGLSLRGDVKYNGDYSFGGVTYDHHALHAESLSFRHPFTFENVHFVAPLPQWAVEAGVQDGPLASEVT